MGSFKGKTCRKTDKPTKYTYVVWLKNATKK